MRILLIEDDHATAQSIELMMKAEGFNVYSTDIGEEGVDLAKLYDYDLILQDINLPDMSGIDCVRQIRAAAVRTPVMMITGSPLIENKVAAFSAGADDFLAKPFHKDELIARCHAIIRRSKGHAQAAVSTGPIVLNLDAKECSVNGSSVHLTGKEYQMLELLTLRKGVTVTKEMFLNHLYGGMDEPEMKIIDVFMCKLRKKLRDAGGGGYVRTVWGKGYRLEDQPTSDTLQKQGTLDSLVGKVLDRLASDPKSPRSRPWLIEVLGVEVSRISGALKNLREKGFAEVQGFGPSTTWSITPAGIAEHTHRQAVCA